MDLIFCRITCVFSFLELPSRTPQLPQGVFIQECCHWYIDTRIHLSAQCSFLTHRSILIVVEDLWTHLAKASNKAVAEVMSAWTKKLGYPVLSVEGKQVATCMIEMKAAQTTLFIK